ncbi:MAG: carboxypeptidase-like regulatory domain-containing protein [Sphingobacterium sp.]|jgi:TonB-dependent SusC/RagA subfamily outer membrane receptor|nr:carboxypeptidase-like regulatory domain-containing protein [Sphingobacterium sp.]
MSKIDFKKVARLKGKSKLFFSLIVIAGTMQHTQAVASSHIMLENPFLNETKKNQQQIKGKILDGTGKPISGVSIAVKGTSKGTQSDASGNFSLDAKSGDVLVISSIGYKTKEVTVSGATISVELEEDQSQLDEVVVVGYGTQKMKEVTSSVAHVSADQFRQSGARNPLDLIQGKVAGLQVSRSGSNPNSGVATQLRGAISVTGSASPLFVIDGIPGGNPDLLQQDDIESIDVLKDGSGAAIYGTSANAGVILITTKRGEAW